MKILVAEPLAAAGIELLKAQPGWDVVVADPKTYSQHLADADALLVRSAVKVNADVLSKAPKLRVIGRAGVGVDNVDLKAATAAGVLVMNTPGGNAVSVAEHTLGLMLAMARSIPQANASTKGGKWEKKKFLGTELRGKTLGVMGLGSIGREVVKRARAFEMKIVATDPFVSSQSAADLGITLVSREELYAQSDYITLHVALTTETQGMLNDATFALMKKGVRIVNCARGELMDGDALRRAIESGQVGGAALDVFQTEPPAAGEPLLAFDNVLATPHIGGSTEEAQEIVGVRIVEQVVEYLQHGVALNAVNVPAMTAEQYQAVGPYIDLAERLGNFAAYVATGNPQLGAADLSRQGRGAEHVAGPQRGIGRSAEPFAGASRQRGERAAIRHRSRPDLRGTTREARGRHGRGPAGTGDRHRRHQRGRHAGVGPAAADAGGWNSLRSSSRGAFAVFEKRRRAGSCGSLRSGAGKAGINIAHFSLGRQETPSKPGAALQAIVILETDTAVPESVVQQILENKDILSVRVVEFKP